MAKNLSLQDLQSYIEKLSLDDQLILQEKLNTIISEKAKDYKENLDKIEKAKERK